MGMEQFMQFGQGFGGIGGAVSSIVGGIGGAIRARKARKLAREMQQKQFDWQREENERAFQRNLQMWNQQNAYNSPAAQMQRLEEAGLNPNLAYGNLASGQAGSPPQLEAANVPQLSDAAYSNPFDSISQMGANLTNSTVQMAQTASLLAQSRKTEEEYNKLRIENSLLPAKMKAEIGKLLSSTELDKESKNNLVVQSEMLGEQMKLVQANVDKVRTEIDGLGIANDRAKIQLAIEKNTQQAVEDMIKANSQLAKLSVTEKQQMIHFFKEMSVRLLTEKDMNLDMLSNEVYKSDFFTNIMRSRESVLFQSGQMAIDDAANRNWANERVSHYNNKTLIERLQRKVNVQSGIIGAFLDYTDAIVPRVRQWFQAGKEFKDLLPRGEVHGEVSDPLGIVNVGGSVSSH